MSANGMTPDGPTGFNNGLLRAIVIAVSCSCLFVREINHHRTSAMPTLEW